MVRRVVWFAVAALAGLGLPAVGSAQAPGEVVTVVDPIDIPPEHDPLEHAWDRVEDRGGFYLRGSLGLGVQNTRAGAAPWESEAGLTVTGFGMGFGLDIGGMLAPWVALHLDATIGPMWSGEIDDDIYVYGQEDEEARVVAYGFAPGFTFFVPHGFYLKSALGVGIATVRSPDNDYRTNPGIYMDLVAGNDVYIDRHFSVGLQFQIAYMRLWADREQEEARIRQFLFGVSFAYDSI